MSDDLDDLDEFAAQTAFDFNVGARASSGGGRPWGVSPQFERAKVARPVVQSPAAAAGAPVALPEVQAGPAVLPRTVTTREELLDLLRARRDEIGVTHETIDHISGLQSGYTSKLLSPQPLKRLGEGSLALLLDALALGIAKIEFTEDPAQVARMRGRWVQRRRPKMRPRRTRGALLAARERQMLAASTEDNNVETPPELPPEG